MPISDVYPFPINLFEATPSEGLSVWRVVSIFLLLKPPTGNHAKDTVWQREKFSG